MMSSGKPVIVHESRQELDKLDHPLHGNIAFRTLFSGDKTPTSQLTAGVAELQPGGWLGLHRHAPVEMYYILEGTAHVTLDGSKHSVGPGHAIFIPGDTEHGIMNSGETLLRVLYTFAIDRFGVVDYDFSDS